MGGNIRVIKDVGCGLRGSTSGLRFNPREAPEFAVEDRNLGRDDPEGKQLYDEKKRAKKKAREKKIKNLHHLNVKIPGKKNPRMDNQRNDEALSELTGPASSTGAPLDAATGAKTGTGSTMGGPNIMTGEPAYEVIESILKRDVSRSKLGTTTLETVSRRERGRKTRAKKKKQGLDVISARHTHKKSLNVFGTRHPERISRIKSGIVKRTKTSKGLPVNKTLTNSRHRSGKNLLTMQANPQKRMQTVHRSQASRMGVTGLPYTIPTAYAAGGSLGAGPPSTFSSISKGGRHNTALEGPVNITGPRKPPVAGGGMPGLRESHASAAVAPIASPTAPPPIASPILASDYPSHLLDEELITKTLSQSDMYEFKFLIRELRRLLTSGRLRKAGLEDSEHDDERPTPNAHRKTTSSPTGATEIDPDDDPRFWGAHPMGLLLPRRGHM